LALKRQAQAPLRGDAHGGGGLQSEAEPQMQALRTERRLYSPERLWEGQKLLRLRQAQSYS
jgi:hypothetical protein